MNWPLYHYIVTFVSFDHFDLKSILSNCNHSCLLLIAVCMEYVFHPFTVSACMSLRLKMSLFEKSISLSDLIFFNPFRHTISFDWII